MCRANACCRTTFPVPVFLNRLDAPLWVLSLGMKYIRETRIVSQGGRSTARFVRARLTRYNENINAVARRGRADSQSVCTGGIYSGSAGPFSRRPSPGVDAGLQ